MDQNQGLPLCSADVCVQPDGRVRYRLRDRVNGATGTTVGSPSAIMPAEWRRIEVRTRIAGGSNDDGCELRLDGVTVASSDTLNLGNLRADLGFLTNRQGAYSQPANPGSWVATFDDIALTEGGWAGPGRIIARQGRPGTPTFNQFTLSGAGSIDAAWSNTPPNTSSAATSPSSGDPLAQTMLVSPFDEGVHPIRPTSSIAACQTWLTSRTTSTPNRVYSFRRRVAGANVDTQFFLIDAFEQTTSDGILGGFWTSPLASLNSAEIGAVKSGGASGAAMRVGDAWLSCEYRPAIGESNCSSGPPPGGTANVRFYGTVGATCAVPNRCDRIRMLVDPPTPVDVGAVSFTVELWVRGNRQDNDLFGTFRPADTTSATVDWTEGNVIVDRDISGTPAPGGGDWGASIHRATDASGPAVIRFGVEDTDGVGAARMTIQGSMDVLDGAWHHVALVRGRGPAAHLRRRSPRLRELGRGSGRQPELSERERDGPRGPDARVRRREARCPAGVLGPDGRHPRVERRSHGAGDRRLPLRDAAGEHPVPDAVAAAGGGDRDRDRRRDGRQRGHAAQRRCGGRRVGRGRPDSPDLDDLVQHDHDVLDHLDAPADDHVDGVRRHDHHHAAPFAGPRCRIRVRGRRGDVHRRRLGDRQRRRRHGDGMDHRGPVRQRARLQRYE
jgi:hypothetical protein